MELIWNDLNINRVMGSTVSQAVVEGNIPLAEGKTAAEVLDASGNVNIERADVREAEVALQGSVSVDLILNGPDGVFAFTSVAAFKHSVEVDGAKPGMNASAKAQLQSLELSLKGGFLAMTSLVDISCRVESAAPLKTLGGIRGANDIETREAPLSLSKKRDAGGESLRLREEMAVKDVNAVLSARGSVRLASVTANGMNADVEGVLGINALCLNAENKLVFINENFPFVETVEADAVGKNLFGSAEVQGVSVRSMGNDFDLLAVDALVSVHLFEKQNVEASLPLDAYSPTMPFHCTHEQARLIGYAGEVNAQHMVHETVSVPSGMVAAARVVYCSARPVVTASAVNANRLSVEGLLFCRVVYESEGGSLFAFREDLPFTADFPVNASDDAEAFLEANCLTASMNGSGHSVQLSFMVFFSGSVYELLDAAVVTGIMEAPASEAPKGIVVYFASVGETLFDVAKRFNISRANLTALNPGCNENLEEGQRLLMLL